MRIRPALLLASALRAVGASDGRTHYDHYVPGFYDLCGLLVILALLVACLCAIDPAPVPYYHRPPECTLVRIDPASAAVRVVVADEKKAAA